MTFHIGNRVRVVRTVFDDVHVGDETEVVRFFPNGDVIANVNGEAHRFRPDELELIAPQEALGTCDGRPFNEEGMWCGIKEPHVQRMICNEWRPLPTVERVALVTCDYVAIPHRQNGHPIVGVEDRSSYGCQNPSNVAPTVERAESELPESFSEWWTYLRSLSDNELIEKMQTTEPDDSRTVQTVIIQRFCERAESDELTYDEMEQERDRLARELYEAERALEDVADALARERTFHPDLWAWPSRKCAQCHALQIIDAVLTAPPTEEAT